MKLKLTAAQQGELEYARYMFDLGNLKRCDEILKEIDPRLTHESLRWRHGDPDAPKPKQRSQAFVVTNYKGYMKEADKIVIHPSEELAGRYGTEVYGRGQFRIAPYNSWQKTAAGKYQRRRVAIVTRLRANRK